MRLQMNQVATPTRPVVAMKVHLWWPLVLGISWNGGIFGVGKLLSADGLSFLRCHTGSAWLNTI
jgi:hypothetical protein